MEHCFGPAAAGASLLEQFIHDPEATLDIPEEAIAFWDDSEFVGGQALFQLAQIREALRQAFAGIGFILNHPDLFQSSYILGQLLMVMSPLVG